VDIGILDVPDEDEETQETVVYEIEDVYELADEDENDEDEDGDGHSDEEKKEELENDVDVTTKKKGRKKKGKGKTELYARGQTKLLNRYKQFFKLLGNQCAQHLFGDDDGYMHSHLGLCICVCMPYRAPSLRQLRCVATCTAFSFMDGLVELMASTRKEKERAQNRV